MAGDSTPVKIIIKIKLKAMYSVDYFINKFEAIPESEWTCYTQQNDKGQRCAYGHCMPVSEKSRGSMLFDSYGNSTEEGKALLNIISNVRGASDFFTVGGLNNGENPFYQQPTPKQRILAALYDIRKMQAPVKEVVKTVYVAVPSTLTKQAAEMAISN